MFLFYIILFMSLWKTLETHYVPTKGGEFAWRDSVPENLLIIISILRDRPFSVRFRQPFYSQAD